MKYTVIIILLLLATPCYGGNVYFGLLTDHTVPGEFNEINNVVITRFDSGFTVGQMTNSYNNDSLMFGYTTSPKNLFSVGVVFATGYEPENITFTENLNSLPLLPLPILSLNIPVCNSMSVTTSIVAGLVINAGIGFHF
jgi:hypothetical protein